AIFFEQSGPGEYVIGGGGAAHAKDGIIVGCLAKVGPAEAIDDPSLDGGNRDGKNGSFELVDLIVVWWEGLPHTVYAFYFPDGAVFFMREDVTGILCRAKAQDAIGTDLHGDVS